MEKDTWSTYRRYLRPIPGAPSLGTTSGHHKIPNEAAELQRSKSVILEKDEKGKTWEALEMVDHDGGKVGPGEEKSDSEASAQGELEKEEDTDKSAEEAKEQELASIKVDDLLEREKPSTFVEIDLGDHAEEVVTWTAKDEKEAPIDPGYLSEDEARTSWMCCIPYVTRKKTKESA
ncbi:uncharacterized protein C13orf46 homolog [Rhynchocyon petersi]